jgi:Transglycosylase SLT domain
MTTDRKAFLIEFVLVALVAIFGGFAVGMFDLTPPPAPVAVSKITETSIQNDYRLEQRQKKLKKATRQAAAVYRKTRCRGGENFAEMTARAALDNGLSPRILAALVFVESSCNPNATDHRGSFGLTQVNSRVWPARKDYLRDPEVNLRIGAAILAGYVHRFGLVEGLHHYNGYGPTHEHIYVNKVLTKAGYPASVPKG